MATLRHLGPALGLFVLLAGCGRLEPVCDICGEGGGKHRIFEQISPVIAKLAGVEGGKQAIQELQALGAGQAKMMCPRLFGELPAAGTVRVLAPHAVATSPDHQVWTWVVIGHRPFHGANTKNLGVTLRCGDPGAVSVNRDHVWVVTMEVHHQLREFGPVAEVNVVNHPATGGGRTTYGMHGDVPTDATLDELVVVNGAEARVAVPGRILLATVDGNPITLDFATGKETTTTPARLPWSDHFTERIYAGRQPADGYAPELAAPPRTPAPVDAAGAQARARAYLAYHEVEDWGEPVQVTRTALNHFRVAFAPTKSGRNRALIVDPKTGFVDHPRHPR